MSLSVMNGPVCVSSNTTSRDSMILVDPFSLTRILHAFDTVEYPTRVPTIDLSESLLRLCAWTCTNALHPNTRSIDRSGFRPQNNWKDVLFLLIEVVLLISLVAVGIASSHNSEGAFASMSSALATFISDLFVRSTFPFCCGVYTALSWCMIPCCLQKLSTVLFLNSVPWSVRRVFTT